MTKKEKLIKKFHKNPESLKCKEIKKVLEYLGFLEIQSKGSHVKFKHSKLMEDIVIPVHGGECKEFYKKEALKKVTKIKK